VAQVGQGQLGIEWARLVENAKIRSSSRMEGIQTADGGFLMVGDAPHRFGQQIDLLKLDSSGAVEWERAVGDVNDIVVRFSNSLQPAIQLADGGYVLAGGNEELGSGDRYHYEPMILRTDATGRPRWRRVHPLVHTFGSDYYSFLRPANDDRFVVALSGTGKEAVLRSIDENGSIVGERRVTPTLPTENHSISVSGLAVTDDGGLVLLADVLRNTPTQLVTSSMLIVGAQADGTVMWQETYSAREGSSTLLLTALVALEDGGFAVPGWKLHDTEPSYPLLLRTDGQGRRLWRWTGPEHGWGWEAGPFLVETPERTLLVALTASPGMSLLEINGEGETLADQRMPPTQVSPQLTEVRVGGILRHSAGGYVVFGLGLLKPNGGGLLLAKIGPATALPGDCNADGVVDISDAICVLGSLFLGNQDRLPCGDGASHQAANVRVLDVNGDAALDVSDAVTLLSFLFLGGRPPSLGLTCAAIPDCPTATGCGAE
jgi:hypothetical protein